MSGSLSPVLNLVRTFKWILGKIVMNAGTIKVAMTEKDFLRVFS